MTALLQASYRGNVKIAQLLVNSGANVNWSKHKQGYTALMFGALVGLSHIFKFIASLEKLKSLNIYYHKVRKST